MRHNVRRASRAEDHAPFRWPHTPPPLPGALVTRCFSYCLIFRRVPSWRAPRRRSLSSWRMRSGCAQRRGRSACACASATSRPPAWCLVHGAWSMCMVHAHGSWMVHGVVHGWCMNGAWMVHAWCMHHACMMHACHVRGACMHPHTHNYRAFGLGNGQVERQLAAEAARRKATGVEQVLQRPPRAACTRHVLTLDMHCRHTPQCTYTARIPAWHVHAPAGARRSRAAGGACGQDAGGGPRR